MKSSKPKYDNRDAVEDPLLDVARRMGASILPISETGGGDVILGWRGSNIMVEIKSKRGRLTPAQVEFHEDWRGQISIIRTEAELVELLSNWDV